MFSRNSEVASKYCFHSVLHDDVRPNPKEHSPSRRRPSHVIHIQYSIDVDRLI